MSDDRSEEIVDLLAAARAEVERLEAELVRCDAVTADEPEDRYRVFVENSADAIFVMNGDTFVDCNRATVEMFGCDDKRQLLEMHPSEVSPPIQPDGTPSYDKANRMLRTAFRNGSHRFEWSHARANGDVFPAEVLVTPISDTGVGTFHAVVRDISQRKELESQLRQSQKMEAMGRLAGGIAHDFNNLLMIINGSSERLLDAIGDKEELAADLRQIAWAGQRAAELTARLLASGRQQIFQPAILDLNQVTTNAHEFLGRLIGEDIELVIRLADHPVTFKADPGLIEQAIINLATNARDAMPEGGTLSLVVDQHHIQGSPSTEGLQLPSGRYARLTVLDTGIGMDNATQERVFEPFFTTKPIGEGSGLGLSMVYGIIRQSDGHIVIQSEPGGGTRVDLWFAVVDDELTEVLHDSEIPLGGDETILVVEDDGAVLAIVTGMLTDAGFDVVSCRNGVDALELCRKRGAEIDLVLSDVVMPTMGGPEFVRRLLARGTAPPVIFASGYTDNRLESFDELGLDIGFLQKPFSRNTLLREVRRYLGKNNG